MKRFKIMTFGCQMNVHDSEKMAGILTEKGLEESDNAETADIIVFNTCSIRDKAQHKFLSELGRMKELKKLNPGLKIAVTGCVAQQMGNKLLKKAPFVDLVIGPQNISSVEHIINFEKRRSFTDVNPLLADIDIPALRNERGRAWVNIMYGCNNYCSYCIVPYTRGREVSRPSHKILDEIKGLAAEGFKEVTLLGQNVNSYKSDIDFTMLLRMIHDIQGIERIRFITSHPRDLSDELIDVMAESPKICECLHLPMQSASSRILKAMNRGYSYDDYISKLERLRAKIPNIAFTTDVIVGFPGETDEDYNMTFQALKDIRYDGIYAFKFSERPGTKAVGLPMQLSEEVKSERLTAILELQDSITAELNNKLQDCVVEVLVEGPSLTDKTKYTGKTRSNKTVNFPHSDDSILYKLVDVQITAPKMHSLDGKVVNT